MTKRHHGADATTNHPDTTETKSGGACISQTMQSLLFSRLPRTQVIALSSVFFAVVASLAGLTGCTTGRPAAAPADAALTAYQPAINGQFAWASREITATARGAVPAHVSGEPQRSLAGTQAAKAAAIGELRRQVAALPVDPTHTVGSFMDESLGLKRAIDRQLQKAAVTAAREVSPGLFEVTVRAPLAPVADILRQFSITPGNLPPPPPAFDGPVPRDI
jgi:hypothetical protein